MVFWVFFDKKQGKFCQNLVALFPFAAKIVGAQKNPLHSVQSAQNQCQKILISVVPDKRKHTYKANNTYFPFFGRFWVRVWCVAVDWVSLVWLFSRFWTRGLNENIFLKKEFEKVWPILSFDPTGSTGTENTIHPLREIMMKVILSNTEWSIVLPLVNA